MVEEGRMMFSSRMTLSIIIFALLCLYGYYYYVQCIKIARELITLYLGEEKYRRLRRY